MSLSHRPTLFEYGQENLESNFVDVHVANTHYASGKWRFSSFPYLSLSLSLSLSLLFRNMFVGRNPF
jgi:hypothetical protein